MASDPRFRSGSGSRRIFFLGLASAVVYLLAFTLIYWLPAHYLHVKDELYQFAAREPWRGILFYVALAVLFGLYLAAYRLVARAGRRQATPWSIGLWTLVFCLLLIPVQPITSSDVYTYVFQGRIVAVLGENPFAHLFRDFAGDPLYHCVTFHHLPASAGYGPLWIAITSGLGWLARDRLLLNLFLFKGLAAGLHLLSTFLVYATLKRVAPEKRLAGMLFYAWNPVLLYELVGNAHNDAAVAALALLGFFLLSLALGTRRSVGLAGEGANLQSTPGGAKYGLLAIPCLAAAALVKPVVVLWLPMVAVWLLAQCPDWPRRFRRAGVIAVLTILPAMVAYAPFWAGATTFQGLLVQGNIYGNSLPNLLIVALWSLWPEARLQIIEGLKLLTILVFAPFYLWQTWRIWPAIPERLVFEEDAMSLRAPQSAKMRREHPQVRPARCRSHVGVLAPQVGRAIFEEGLEWERLIRASFDVMLFYLLFVGFQFWPWYLTWLLVPAALLTKRPFSSRHVVTIVLCVMAPFLYFPFGWQWVRNYLPAWAEALFAALPMLGLGACLGVRAWQRYRAR